MLRVHGISCVFKKYKCIPIARQNLANMSNHELPLEVTTVTLRFDPAMKQFLLHLDETLGLGRKFIIQDLDESHLFISTDIVETLQAKVDDLMDKISFPLHEKEA